MREKIETGLLCAFILVLPLNLYIGRLFPVLVSLPFYFVDIIIMVLGILLIIRFLKKRTNFLLLEKQEKFILFLACCFFVLNLVSLIQHLPTLFSFFSQNSWETIFYAGFKEIISSSSFHGINKVIMLFFALVLFLAIVTIRCKRKTILYAGMISLCIILIGNVYLTILQKDVQLDGGKVGTTIQPYSITDFGRIYFPFVNTLLLGLYLSLFFFVVLHLFFQERKRGSKYYYLGFLFFLLIILDWTKARITILVIFILLLTLLFLQHKKVIFPEQKKWSVIFSLFLLFIILHIFIFHQYSMVSVARLYSPQMLQEGIDEGIEEEKEHKELQIEQKQHLIHQYTFPQARRSTNHWPTALILFREHLFFGVGTGMFYFSVLDAEKETLCKYPSLCPETMPPTDISSTAHSIYLQVLAETGIIGFILFIAFLCCLLYFGYKKATTDLCSLFLLFALVAFLLQGFFFSYFEYREITYLFWLFVGLLLKREL